MVCLKFNDIQTKKVSQTERTSERDFAVFMHNHLHAVGRQRQKQHKQRDLQFASTITYTLWEGKGRNSIRKGICSFQAQSLTHCGKGKGRNSINKGICSLQAQSLTHCGKAKAETA
jgi:hypothetical protein